jgi:hypothetical protein
MTPWTVDRSLRNVQVVSSVYINLFTGLHCTIISLLKPNTAVQRLASLLRILEVQISSMRPETIYPDSSLVVFLSPPGKCGDCTAQLPRRQPSGKGFAGSGCGLFKYHLPTLVCSDGGDPQPWEPAQCCFSNCGPYKGELFAFRLWSLLDIYPYLPCCNVVNGIQYMWKNPTPSAGLRPPPPPKSRDCHNCCR